MYRNVRLETRTALLYVCRMAHTDGGSVPVKRRRTARSGRFDQSSGTTERILDAAERLLAERPLSEVSVAEMCEAAEVARPTFYYHFKSKYEVVGGLLNRIMDEIAFEVRPFVEADAARADVPASELYEHALRASLHGATQVWREHRPILQAMSEGWTSSPELEDLWRVLTGGFIDVVATTIDNLRSAGVAPPGPPSRTVASSLAWATERCLYVSSLETEADMPNEDAVIAPLVGMWLGAVFGSADPGTVGG